jgi:flagellar basal-body rod protein FlgB
MFDILSGEKTMALLEAAMDISTARHSLIASNIANVDTPGYRAKDIAFEKELNIALRQVEGADVPPGSMGRFTYEMRLQPRIFEVENITPRQDGNTVDMDKELGKLERTSSQFNKAVTMYSMKLKMIKAALTGE